jgi:hypothetical protein
MGRVSRFKMRCATGGLLAGIAGLCVAPAAAHPHVFIDTTITAILNDSGQLAAVRLRWDYDSVVSMLVVEDAAADVDLDGRITPAEAAALDGFDMTWIEGFDGDTSVFQAETPLPLEPGPQDWATGWVAVGEGGHLWSEHTRKLVSPVDPGDGPVSFVVYDISDYTAYVFTAAALRPVDPAGIVPVDCRIGPPSQTGADAEAGFLSTLGLFVFGKDDGKTAGSVVPTPAPGRAIAVLSCG